MRDVLTTLCELAGLVAIYFGSVVAFGWLAASLIIGGVFVALAGYVLGEP